MKNKLNLTIDELREKMTHEYYCLYTKDSRLVKVSKVLLLLLVDSNESLVVTAIDDGNGKEVLLAYSKDIRESGNSIVLHFLGSLLIDLQKAIANDQNIILGDAIQELRQLIHFYFKDYPNERFYQWCLDLLTQYETDYLYRSTLNN